VYSGFRKSRAARSSPAGLEAQQHFAEFAGLRHVVERLDRLLRGEDTVDDASSPPIGEERQDVVAERLDRGCLLLQRPGAQHRAVDARTAPHQGAERERRLVAGAGPDDHDSPLHRECLEIARQVGRADELEHDVGSPGSPDALDRVARTDDLGAVFSERKCSLLGADVREHPRTPEDRELYRGGADAAARSVHEQHVAGSEPCLADESVVRGHERLGYGRGLLLVEALGHRDHVALVHDHPVGQPAAADEAKDAVADLPAPHLLAQGDNAACDLEAGNVLRSAGRSRVAARALREVGRVDPGVRGGDNHLAASRHRVGQLLESQLVSSDRDCPHPATVTSLRVFARRRLHGVRIALAQLDSRLGDLEANTRLARETVAAARTGGADLVVFPELQLSGYALGAVEHDTSRTAAVATAAIADGVAALVGFHERDGERRYNSAAYVEDGALLHVHRKLHLVDYAPFEENAHFASGESMHAFDTSLGRAAVLICNDAWQPFLPLLAVQDSAELLLIPAASSTVVPEAESYWREATRFYARELQCYVVFVNRVGVEAGFTFWGGSHVVDPLGEIVAEAPRFEESLLLADFHLDRVAARRRELPLAGELRPDLLRAELERLTTRRTR
jgi:N-carbamoylputrescine amidase